MHQAFLNTAADVQWLKDTHLNGVTLPAKYKDFECAILQGNEDSPYAVNLYIAQEPHYQDNYYRVKFDCNDPMVYCECMEYNGKTDKPLPYKD